MRQEPFLLKDLVAISHKLPNPDTFEFPELSIPIKDSISGERKDLLFRKWSRVSKEKVEHYWVFWHTIAIK